MCFSKKGFGRFHQMDQIEKIPYGVCKINPVFGRTDAENVSFLFPRTEDIL